MRIDVVLLAALMAAAPLAAQEAEAPISAIDWLSDVVRQPTPFAPDRSGIPDSAAVEVITVAPLDAMAIDAVGLTPAARTGLARDFWGSSESPVLAGLLQGLGADLPAPARDLLLRILLAELDPPVDAGPDHALFLARIDTLLRFGALDQALALLDRAGARDPQVFRRWFDVSLLTGNEDRACAAMRAAPDIAPTFSARIFCLARGNDWAAAALSLETAAALGFLDPAEDEVMARFLDPELFEGVPIDRLPDPITPLSYRMLLALGEAPPASALPVAFSHALMGPAEGWKTRLETAERLARTGGVAAGLLFAVYAEREPAASGGIWDRVAAVQAVDIALIAGDSAALSKALPEVVRQMKSAGLLPVFADYYGDRLRRAPLDGDAADLVVDLTLLTPGAEAVADRVTDPALAALARGLPFKTAGQTQLAAAISEAFADQGEPIPLPYGPLLSQNRAGEVILRALSALAPGADADPDDVTLALRVLRRLGFEGEARQIGLHLMILGQPG